ncbi:MAG: helix-turn-helix domain-containing protein [Oscillospiraceae bacterium]
MAFTEAYYDARTEAQKARLDRGLTQAQVVGDRITRNMLSQLENDLASPSVGTLEYLASVLGVQAAWLLADEKEEEAAGRTERLRACYRGGDWAGCLELAQDLQPDDEQALLLALAAAQCALHALEAERFAAAQQLARQALSWNKASLYGHAQVRLEMLRVLARCARADRRGRRGGLRRLPRRLYRAAARRAVSPVHGPLSAHTGASARRRARDLVDL